MSDDPRVHAIVACNSIGFLEEAFKHLNAGGRVVVLRSEDDQERIRMAGANEIVTPSDSCGWAESLEYERLYEDSAAQIQFTSGTEGEPKAIVLTHASLATTTDRLVSIMQLDDSVREYVGVPVYYSFGFGRCRAISVAGGAAYIPENGFDPLEIANMLEAGEINALSAVPSLLRLILDNAELFDACGTQMKWVEIGSQYMSRSEKEALKSIFPNAKIVQHYGLTEASRSTFLKIHEVEGDHLESVGKTYDGVEVAVSESERIKVKGPHTALGHLVDGNIVPLVDADGWLETNDRGHMEDGFLYFDGRMDDVINCGGIKLAPERLEQEVRKRIGDDVQVSIAKIADPLRGEAVLVAHPSSVQADDLRPALEEALSLYGVQAGKSVKFFACDAPPVTETGKVRRSELAALYQAANAGDDADPATGAEEAAQSDAAESAQTQALVKIWEEALGISPISIHDSFFDLGGDSLSAISVVMKFQKEGIPQHVAREILEGRTIAEIVNRATSSNRGTPLANGNLTVNAVRGLLVLCVIGGHWMPGVIERLPEVFAYYNQFLSPLYSAGTPGFAIIFGMGLGFAYLPRYLRNPDSVTPLVYRNAILLLLGIFAMGAVRIGASLAMGEEMRPTDYSNSFYGVLTYYVFAVLSIPLWLKFLSRYSDLWIPSLATAAVCYLVHLTIEANNPTPSENPLIQSVILWLTAAYNYFEMTAGVMVGLALGTWFRQLIIDGKSLHVVWQTGVLLVTVAAYMGWESGYSTYWLQWPKPIVLSTWFFYAGSVLVGSWLLMVIVNRAGEEKRFSDTVIKGLSIIGILAFPLFIGHELVIPFKDLLEAFQIPFALTISLTIFFAVSLYLGMTLQKVFYARELGDAAVVDETTR